MTLPRKAGDWEKATQGEPDSSPKTGFHSRPGCLVYPPRPLQSIPGELMNLLNSRERQGGQPRDPELQSVWLLSGPAPRVPPPWGRWGSLVSDSGDGGAHSQ